MAPQRIESPPRVLAVSDCPILNLGLETLVRSNAPNLEWEGAISKMESLATASERNADVIVTDLDSTLGQSCVNLLGAIDRVSLVALIGTATDDQIDESVLKGLKGVVQKGAPPHVLLKAILTVYQGELWLDRRVTGRILRGLTTPEVKPTSILERLTKREQVIYKAVISRAGSPSRLIADDLHISEHTLRNHLTAIYSKLGVSSRLELLVLAHEENS